MKLELKVKSSYLPSYLLHNLAGVTNDRNPPKSCRNPPESAEIRRNLPKSAEIMPESAEIRLNHAGIFEQALILRTTIKTLHIYYEYLGKFEVIFKILHGFKI